MKSSRRKQLTEKRDAKIYKDFCRMANQAKYTADFIYSKLSDKFFLLPETLYRIVLEQKGIISKGKKGK